jgi:hypothetical protein
MKCPRCQHENHAAAKFCQECGAALARVCSNCQTHDPDAAKFCPECAHPLAASAAEPRFASPKSYTTHHLAEKILTSKSAFEGERKQVTVLFADLKGSMELLADRDSREARKLLDPVLEHMMAAVHRYEGTVNQVMGEGIMALFGAPIAQEQLGPLAARVLPGFITVDPVRDTPEDLKAYVTAFDHRYRRPDRKRGSNRPGRGGFWRSLFQSSGHQTPGLFDGS